MVEALRGSDIQGFWRNTADYYRSHSVFESPHTSVSDQAIAYRELQQLLSPSPYPESQLVDPELIRDDDLIIIPGTSAVVGAGIGNATGEAEYHARLSLGIPVLESPLPQSGLDPSRLTTLIRFNRQHTDPEFREILKATAKLIGKPANDLERYVDHFLPLVTIWLAAAQHDALKRVNDVFEGQLLGSNGKIINDLGNNLRDRTALLIGNAGAGVLEVHHRRNMGAQDPYVVVDILDATQAGFLLNQVNAGTSYSISRACSATGAAYGLAEVLVQDRRHPKDIFIVGGAFNGPYPESQQAFRNAGIDQSDALPFLRIGKKGYSESSLGCITVLVTARFLKERGISLQGNYVLRTSGYEGTSQFGVGKDIARAAVESYFRLAQEFYPPNYDGAMVYWSHGVNTEGWFLEQAALLAKKNEYFPHATMFITSTQPQDGHSYQTRSALSTLTHIRSAEEGIVPGMANALLNIDPILPRQSHNQAVRKQILENLTGENIESKDIVYAAADPLEDAKNYQRTVENMQRWEDNGIILNATTQMIPVGTPGGSSHPGLGGGVNTVNIAKIG